MVEYSISAYGSTLFPLFTFSSLTPIGPVHGSRLFCLPYLAFNIGIADRLWVELPVCT